MIDVLSLGAGVQSSTLALMAAHGEIEPVPSVAIFADTQNETDGLYRWLDWLEQKLPFPIVRVTIGKLSDRELTLVRSKRSGKLYRKSEIPAFGFSADGKRGLLGRKCTRDFKIDPITRYVRKFAGINRGQKDLAVIQWIGISLDEMQRMKPSRNPWSKHRWPLIEKRLTRTDCLRWMADKGYPTPPRSACVFCPFHSDREWRRLQVNEPDEFQKAVAFEKQLQAANAMCEVSRSVKVTLHASGKSLDEIDFRNDEDRGQMSFTFWQDECSGMCGV